MRSGFRRAPIEPGAGLCAHSPIRGACGQCGETVALHFPMNSKVGLCGHCCPVCAAQPGQSALLLSMDQRETPPG